MFRRRAGSAVVPEKNGNSCGGLIHDCQIRNSIAIEIRGGKITRARVGSVCDLESGSDGSECSSAGSVVQKNRNGAIAKICDGEIEMAIGIKIADDNRGRRVAGLKYFVCGESCRAGKRAGAIAEQNADGIVALIYNGEIDVTVAIEIPAARATGEVPTLISGCCTNVPSPLPR